MRLPKAFTQYGLAAVAVPGLLLLTGISTLADASQTPSAAGAALPGDPAKGQTLYSTGTCAGCHGANMEGNIGPALNPIFKLSDVPNSLDPNFLIQIITDGRTHKSGDPGTANMPAKGGITTLTDQDIKDIASYIIQQNQTGSPPLSANELAKSTMFFVGVAILGMVFITFLLAQYNMRWIARRAAARHK